MSKEFIDALNLLAAERNLDREQLLVSFEEALEQAFERNVMPGKQIEVMLDPETGDLEVLVIRRVVEEIEDEDKEILLDEALALLSDPDEDRERIDEFSRCEIGSAEDIAAVFTERFSFGCEADDPMNALAFARQLAPLGSRLRAIFSSDIGHWDVPDMTEVLPEAYELVEKGLLDERDFRDFVFAFPAQLWRGTNPDFFRGTAVEDAAAAL